jgi:hypothetical protein
MQSIRRIRRAIRRAKIEAIVDMQRRDKLGLWQTAQSHYMLMSVDEARAILARDFFDGYEFPTYH